MPKATCLACGQEYTPYYASQAHDCRISLAEHRPYYEWLLQFQRWGLGVLKTPNDRKFPDFARDVSGRSMLTQHLQSDIHIGPGWELKPSYYKTEEWREAGFPAAA
jgi:hypothetical protein